MNSTQVILLIAPVVLGYLYFVLTAESNGRINRLANLFSGLIVVPLILGFLPIILGGAILDLLKKRKWGEVIVTSIFLLLLGGYGALIIHLRDPRPPSPWNLPVEQSIEKPLEPLEQPVEKQ